MARAYGVSSVVYIENWDEYLRLSQTQEVTEHLYVIGKGIDHGDTTETPALSTEEKSPVHYQIAGSS